MEGGRNYTKIFLFSGEEKHVNTYMIVNTTRIKTTTKYFKEVKTKNEGLNF